MATPEEEKAIREAINQLAREQSQIENDRLNLSFTLVETLKEALGITTQRNDFDRNLLSVNREITRSLLNQKEGLREINDIERQIIKNNDVVAKAQKLQESLTNSIGDGLSKEFEQSERILARRQRIDQILQNEIDKLNAGEAIDQSKIDRLTEMAQVADEQLANSLRNLSVSEQQLLVTRQNAAALEAANEERQLELKLAEQIKDASGITGQTVGALGKLLGFSNDQQNEIKQGAKEILQARQDEGTLLDGYKGKIQGLGAFASSFGTVFKKAVTDPAAIFTAITSTLFRIDGLIAGLEKGLGISRSAAKDLRDDFEFSAGATNDIFVNSTKLQDSFFKLKEQAGVVFDVSSQSAETFLTLTERLGMAGSEAANLTTVLRLQGPATEETLGNLVDVANETIKTSKTTATAKDLLNDAASASKGLQASLSANPAALVKSAAAARELGATLKDIEGIQGKLLDFEGSISAELEAELLTGKQLNLEKARTAALNNDLETVGKELQKQGVDLASFSNMNAIQQEKMAAAMGLSRDALGEMLMRQETQNMTQDEIRDKFGEQTLEQMKALSAQDKFNAAVEKVKDLFGSIMTVFSPIIDIIGMIVQPIAYIVGLIEKLNKATGGFTNFLLASVIAAKALGVGFGDVGSMISGIFKKDTYTNFFNGINDKIKGLSEPLKGLKDKILGAFSGDKGAGIEFDPRMAGGGRFRDMTTGRLVSEEAANAAGVFKPGTGPAAAAASGAADAAGATGATPAPADNGETLKEKMQNIAEGIKSFADGSVLKGAFNMLLSAPGIIALGLASLPLKITEKLNGKAVESGMKGIARGVASFAQASAGILPLIGAAGALAILTLGLPGLAGVALLGAPAAAGLTALTGGLTALGAAAATGIPFLGAALLAAFGVALIPFGAALGLAAPAIEAVGTVIATTIMAIADAVVTVIPALTQSLIDLSNNVNLAGLFGLALALPTLALGLGTIAIMSPMIAFSALTLLGLGMALMPLSAAAEGLDVTANSLIKVAEAVQLLDISKVVALAVSIMGLTASIVGLMALGPIGLSALALVGGIGAVGVATAAAVGGGAEPGGGAAVATGGETAGEDMRAMIEETVTSTINALVPEMVAALREGQGNIKVTNDNFNASSQGELPSQMRNISNSNFA